MCGVVYLKEYFYHKDKEGDHMCLVFETLGKSLYDFIKANNYKGMQKRDNCVISTQLPKS